jgi:hypothetical protein
VLIEFHDLRVESAELGEVSGQWAWKDDEIGLGVGSDKEMAESPEDSGCTSRRLAGPCMKCADLE